MTPLLKRMEKLDSVTRSRNPRDERSARPAKHSAHAPGIYQSISGTFGFGAEATDGALRVPSSIVDRAAGLSQS